MKLLTLNELAINYNQAPLSNADKIILLYLETCGALYVRDGLIHYSESSLTTGQYPVGTVATWTCNYGFHTYFSYDSTCETSGTWSHRTRGSREPACAQCNENII